MYGVLFEGLLQGLWFRGFPAEDLQVLLRF